jgi:hypothetical protein
MTKDKFQLVYVEWCDAVANTGWASLRDALEWGKETVWMVRQCGWVLDETKEYILLGSRNQDSLEEWGNLQKIPKTWIKKRKLLKV